MAVFARNHAITTGKLVEMKVDRGSGAVTLFERSEDGTQETSLGAEWDLTLPDGIAITHLEIDDDASSTGEIAFYPDGGARRGRLVLALVDDQGRMLENSEQKQVLINKVTGRVQVS